jgi:uncharacterized protein (TIGR02145 family)
MNIPTVKIGNQTWISENLEVKTFQNGDIIPFYKNIQDFLKAGRHRESACCYYENNPQKGLLYNWYATNDERGICPEGFKIPSEKDWLELVAFCGGETIAAKHLKSKYGWEEPINAPKPAETIPSEVGNGIDSFRFNAKPMGAMLKTQLFAEFFGFGSDAYFWTADTSDFYNAWGRIIYMYYFSTHVMVDAVEKRLGFPVRCIKNKYL